ncbi:transposase [Methanosarcina mazei]|uniref:Transposase n=1 Tax=Methanosarcina mazei TaxID=2209 RepID=A0A6C0VPB3_METMZ|nr:transposase [Methanosarcina mazei]
MKIHAAVTSEDLPLSIVIGSGAEYDPYRFEETIGAIKVRTGYRPITRPEEIVADSIYDDAQVREYLRRRRIKASIPENKRNRKKRKRGRPRRFNKESYKKRSAVERFFSRIKTGFRRIILRYERLDRIFRALVIIATFFIYWEKLQEKL